MVTTAKQARVNNMTRSEIIDIAIQEKTEMVRTGRLKYETMCYGGLLRENSYKAVFEEISIDPSPEMAFQDVSDDDIKLGKDLFVSMVFCSKDAIKPYLFLDGLLSNESPRTIIKATVNTIQSKTFSKFVSDNNNYIKTMERFKQFYLALDKLFDFQLAKILLATESIPHLQAMRDNDLPYSTKFTKTLDKCLTGTSCESVMRQVDNLGI